jgi:Cu(I)/Ag(I) efflux system membrane protein CusA/SilA
MIEKIISWSAKNRFLVIALVFLLAYLGIWSISKTPLDAVPDLSDVQVIVFTEWPGRSPDLVEDQITYPIVTKMLSVPNVQFVRGQSMFGLSFVYVIFKDGTDMYWARSRVLEYLQGIQKDMPEGAAPTLGPDATGVGWVFQYALVDESGNNDLSELRTFQDWYLRYWLTSIDGVAEVASIGGYVKQYQVEINPTALLSYSIPLESVIKAIRRSNEDVGGRVVEWTETEYMVRGRGYIKSLEDLENIPLKARNDGTPVFLRDVAKIQFGPDIRRGLLELDGKGESVGGIVIMRYGENALRIIERVKERLKEIEPSLPPGVKVVTAYDRSILIKDAIKTLKHKLTEEMLVVSLVIMIFLWHVRSALIPVLTLPVAVILSFIPMAAMGLTSNIMSLGGIAIAIGAMVDSSIVLIENSHKRIEEWKRKGKKEPYNEMLIHACQETGRPIFFALLLIAIAFMPIFTLEGQEGRLFKPLAFTKNYAMAFAAILSITLVPALITTFVREKTYHLKSKPLNAMANFFLGGKIHDEEKHPISRILFKIYEPIVRWVLDFRKTVIGIAAVLMLVTIPLGFKIGSEFMPPLWEGSFLYMPTAVPGISIEKVKEIIHTQNKIIKTFPEVEHVFGKAGRARTSTDPAPLSMIETTISLKPMKEWRKGMTVEKLKKEMDEALQFPGMPNIWWMPIQTRTEMLATGIRSVLGVKVLGNDLGSIEKTALEIESTLKDLPGTKTVFAERVSGGFYVDFEVNRKEAARYNLKTSDVNDVIQTAIGGMNITQTVEGRERYSINVRYPRELRNDMDTLGRVLVATPDGRQIPISQIADIQISTGPPMIRDENGSLSAFVFVDIEGKDIGRYVEDAKKIVREKVNLPPGTALEWAGQYRYLQRAMEKLKLVLPVTFIIIFILLYMSTKSLVKVGIVFLAVPFSLIGAVWILWLLGYNMSIAVWVGLIALAGVDAETGTVMLLYLDMSYEDAKKKGKLRNYSELKEAVIHGAVKRVRPKLMTVGTTFMGLMPIMWAGMHQTGADVMKRIAAPMVGGIFTSFAMELLLYPAIYLMWKMRSDKIKDNHTVSDRRLHEI